MVAIYDRELRIKEQKIGYMEIKDSYLKTIIKELAQPNIKTIFQMFSNTNRFRNLSDDSNYSSSFSLGCLPHGGHHHFLMQL